MIEYNEATQPGSSFPNRATLPPDHGAILPRAPEFTKSLGPSNVSDFGVGSFTAPPATNSGKGIPRYPAIIEHSLPPIGPSVAETVYEATPVSNITSILRDLPGVARRPVIPAGLRERASSALPEGIRQRATVWARAVARFRSSRPTTGGRITRE